MTADHLPDFMIIGRPRCGSTTLAKWLGAQPEIFFCRFKEPLFFNNEERWGRGLDWYRSLYDGAKADQLLGEATVGYTNPSVGARAADRIARIVPGAMLIYLVRHPVDRVRSSFRYHHSSRVEPSDSLVEALRRPANDHIALTMYYSCLAPYIERFPREQILVVRMEDLVGPGASGWENVLGHLGLPTRPRPDSAHNVSVDRGYRPRFAHRIVGAVDPHNLRSKLPPGIRRAGRRLAWRRGGRFRQMLVESDTAIPSDLLSPVWEDIARLETWLGLDEPLWRDSPMTPGARKS